MQEHTILGLPSEKQKQGRQKKIPKLWSHMCGNLGLLGRKMFLILETSEKPFFSTMGDRNDTHTSPV